VFKEEKRIGLTDNCHAYTVALTKADKISSRNYSIY